jgi:hypothetical protein
MGRRIALSPERQRLRDEGRIFRRNLEISGMTTGGAKAGFSEENRRGGIPEDA